MAKGESIISQDRIAGVILHLRGHKVIIDTDLANLYGVETRILVRAVKRNLERFPPDFMFQLSNQEVRDLRSQFGISSLGYGGRRTPPYAFTDYGILMLSSVLRSPRAIQVNIEIMRTFTRLRELLLTHRELAEKLAELEKRYDAQFKVVFNSIREMLQAKPKGLTDSAGKKRNIGFGRDEP